MKLYFEFLYVCLSCRDVEGMCKIICVRFYVSLVGTPCPQGSIRMRGLVRREDHWAS